MITEIEFAHSMNIVDDKGTFVGYSTVQECCESCNHRYVLADGSTCDVDSLADDAVLGSSTPIGQDSVPDCCEMDCDQGYELFFPITHHGAVVAYLHVYNVQNGFYSHSWKSGILEVKENGYI